MNLMTQLAWLGHVPILEPAPVAKGLPGEEGGSWHHWPQPFVSLASPPLPPAGDASHPSDLEPGVALVLANATRADTMQATPEWKRQEFSPYRSLPALFFFSLRLW